MESQEAEMEKVLFYSFFIFATFFELFFQVQFLFGPQEMEVDTKITVIAMGMQPQFIPLRSVVPQNPDIYPGILKHVQQPWLQPTGGYFWQNRVIWRFSHSR